MENWTNFFPSCTPPKDDMSQFHDDHHPSPFYPFDELPEPEVDSFFNASDDLLDLETTGEEVMGGHIRKTTQFSPPSKIDDQWSNGGIDNNNINLPATPMISFLGNPTAAEEPIIDFNALLLAGSVVNNYESAERIRPGAAASLPERDQSPPRPHGAVAARNLWTLHEHKLFLVGMQIYGKGKWRNIAKKVVMTKTTSQVASHAQKYFLRQQSAGVQKRKRSRSSIHDITTVDPELLLQVLAAQQPPPPLSPSPSLKNYSPPSMLPAVPAFQ